jgi:long-chain acyl-CoA synthetase
MLFERWREIAGKRAGELALCDLASGKTWTFAQLSAAAEAREYSSKKIVMAEGQGTDFVITVLSAWRRGKIVCPLEPGQPAPEHLGVLPKRTVHLKTTSASTGKSKLVAFTATQLAADARNIVSTMGLRPGLPNLGLISLAHSYGFSNLVLPLFLHGVPLYLLGSTLPEALRKTVHLKQDLALPAVPALWRVWHDAGAIPDNIRIALSAGSPLPLSVEQNIHERFGLKVHNFFGSSECGGIAYDRSSAPRTDPAFIGRAMDNVSLSVAKDGCLEVRGDAVGDTYWPDATRKLHDGIFHTGDLVELQHGDVFFRGRACDRINVAGRKVLPEVIERAVLSHPDIRECLVFGVLTQHTGRGENIVVCVTGKSGLDLEAVKRHVLTQLPAWQVPRDWWQVDSLQTSPRGKVSRAEWRRRYLEKAS